MRQPTVLRTGRRWIGVALILSALLVLTSCGVLREIRSIAADLNAPVRQLLTDSSLALDSADGSSSDQSQSAGDNETSVSVWVSPNDPDAPTGEDPNAPDQTASLPSEIDAQFDQLVTRAIVSALDQYQHQASLDAVITRYHLSESQSETLINRVYDLYEQVFRDNPEYFWLDGSARISYSILQTATPVFSAMTLEMGFSEGLTDASAATLQSRQQAMLSVAAQIADGALGYPEPWRKLQYVHDTLVSTIVYDETLDQRQNNAASALVDQLTLCQGYAQSFQLIARDLGFEVTLITGTAEGIDHAWNLVWLDGQPYHVDVTHDDPLPDGGTGPVTHLNFLRSDAIMRQTHVWADEDYSDVDLDGAHYYKQNNLSVANQDELSSRIGDFVASADLKDGQSNQMELLYTGPDLPDKTAIEALLISHLREKPGVRSIVYRASSEKNVISLELLPSS